MRKQPQATEQTRDNLREAFWSLYAERPIEKIAVREITDRAGYNRATFYLHYHDVYEVLEEVEDRLLGDLEHIVNERLLKGEKLDFSQHMSLILGIAQASRRYTEVLLGDHGDPAFVLRMKEVLAPLVDRFVAPCQGLDGQSGRIVREFYLSGLVAAIRTWSAEDDPMPIDRLIELILRAVM